MHSIHVGHVGVLVNIHYAELLDFMLGWFGSDICADDGEARSELASAAPVPAKAPDRAPPKGPEKAPDRAPAKGPEGPPPKSSQPGVGPSPPKGLVKDPTKAPEGLDAQP